MQCCLTTVAGLLLVCWVLQTCGDPSTTQIVNPEDGPEDHGEEQPVRTGVNENGDEIVEGDVAYRKGSGQNRNAITDDYYKWPKDKDGKVYVPYTVSNSFSSDVKTRIQHAMNDFHTYTCIRFVERTDQKGYIYLYPDSGCWSYIGYQHSRQDLSLGRGCGYKGIASHELLHALGIHHEQKRPDRDQYITIHWGNIGSSSRNNFEKCNDCNTLGYPYEYGSVMHYGYKYFSRNGQNTITPKDPKAIIGQRHGMSLLDLKKLNKFYGCDNDLNGWTPPPCEDNHNNCAGWARSGECSRNPDWMLKNCRLSCEVCSLGTTAAAKTTMEPEITEGGSVEETTAQPDTTDECDCTCEEE